MDACIEVVAEVAAEAAAEAAVVADRGAEAATVDEVAAHAAAQAAADAAAGAGAEPAAGRLPVADAAAPVGTGGTESAGTAAAGMKSSGIGIVSAAVDTHDAAAEAAAEAFGLVLLAADEALAAFVIGSPSSATSDLIQGCWSVSVAVARRVGL